MAEITNLQIEGPVVVLPLAEYLEIKEQIEAYQRLKNLYDQQREARFQRLFQIADNNQDFAPDEIDADISAAINAVRSA